MTISTPFLASQRPGGMVSPQPIQKCMFDCACHSAGVDVDEQAAPQLVGDLLESAQMELEGRTGDSDLDDDVEPEPEEQ
ncbi:hypothetical protein BDQ17DRAFT_1436291 [Cyathus striatus]|nr:hypothetical protein BDQ17DRAFT_1436291 [Cyathus striatus]